MAYTAIDDPEAYFQVKTYTGNGTAIGSGGLAVTLDGDTDMQPDLVWIKVRSTTHYHVITDAVRGATKQIYPNDVQVEGTRAEGLTAFGSDGFTLGNEADTNQNTATYVAWCWKAGTAFSNDASATSVGTIDSAGSASATAGFSIVSFDLTGESGNETIKHGLSTAPKVVITKRRSGGAGDWTTWHDSLGVYYLVLSGTAAQATTSDFMNDTDPTSSVFTVGDPSWWGANPYIAYCFSDIQGFSKFGSYTGNGNADGTFVYTGFRPAWIMVKKTNGTTNWQVIDTKRSDAGGFNVVDKVLSPNANDAEYDEGTAGSWIGDILSNGFKWRGNWGAVNASGDTFIYMAFAEAPFVNSNGVPCNAR